MSFENRFCKWLDGNMTNRIPADVRAFAFNLYETSTEGGLLRFGIELIGAPTFSQDDPDWACEEVFEATPRSLAIPIDYSGPDWQACLRVMKKLTASYLSSDKPGAHKLKSAKAVGIGFVDGDMHILWP